MEGTSVNWYKILTRVVEEQKQVASVQRNFLRSDRIRVLVNGIHAKSGGGVTYLRNILPLLAQDDELEVHLFLHRDQFQLFGTVDERVRVHLLRYPNGFFANLLWEQIVLPVLARVMSVDVTLSPANYGPLLAPAPVIVLRNSLAVAGRETRLLKRLYWGGLTLMTALSLIFCRRAIAVSHYARHALTFGVSERLKNKVSVVYHGVRDNFSPDETVGREDFLLAVSDIYVQKNLHTLVAAMSIIRESRPGIKLKLVGRAVDQGYLQEIQDAIADHDLQDNIEFLGELDHVALTELYRKCAVFVFPSTVETFGNPLVEAMACGAPIASSDTAAMPEILKDAAAFFDPLDASGMAEAVEKVLSEAQLRVSLSANALKRARDFSWTKTAKQTADVVKLVARNKSAGLPHAQMNSAS